MAASGTHCPLADVYAPPPFARAASAHTRRPPAAWPLVDGDSMDPMDAMDATDATSGELGPCSHAATRASHGSQGDRCSDTSHAGSGDTTLANAPRERFVSSAFGPAAHRREETTRVTAEGRLSDVRVRIEWSPGTLVAQLVLTCEASCHGKTIRCSDRGWRSRPVEASRRLMRELLANVRLAVEAGEFVGLGEAIHDLCHVTESEVTAVGAGAQNDIAEFSSFVDLALGAEKNLAPF